MKKKPALLESNAMRRAILFHIAVAVAAAAAALLANEFMAPNAQSLPAFLRVPTEQVQALLGTLAGALLTVTIFLYSTTIVVLTTYSAQFTPRVIENFINNRSTTQVFGVFIGGSIYCMITLFFVRKSSGDTVLFVAGAATVYTLVCMVFFIVFILSVSASVQVQNLLTGLAREALRVVEKFVASRGDTVRTGSYSTQAYRDVYHVRAVANGFFEANDIGQIRALLKGGEYTIVLYPRLGDFVSVNQRVASLYYNDIQLTAEVMQGLAQAFVLAEKRYTGSDYRFAIQKITEVALKALSASINDPNTAVYCIRHLGTLTGRLAEVDGKYAVLSLEREGGPNAKIVDQDFIFERDLRDTFVPIIHYAKEDIMVVSALLEALHAAALVATEGNRRHIEAMAGYLYATVAGNFTNPLEAQLLAEKLAPLRAKGEAEAQEQ